MEVRKLQRTAGGTFLLTIPKEWSQKLKFRAGDSMYVELDEDSIVITPTRVRPVSQSRSIEIDQFGDRKILDLAITASYIQGHDVTEVISKHMIHPDKKHWIKHAVDGLVGVEIAESYAERVVLQNLVDPLKFDLDSLLERFSETSMAVFKDATRALVENDLPLAQDAFERGAELVKLYRLIMRLTLQVTRSRTLREQTKVPDLFSALMKVFAIRGMGRIAYYDMRIAQHVGEIEGKVEREIVSIIEKMAKVTVKMLEQSFTALVHSDLNLASSVIDRMEEVRRMYGSAYLLVRKQQPEATSLALSLIIRDMRAIAGYAVSLADDAVLGVFR